MAKKTSVPVAPEAKEVLGAVKTVPTKAPVPGMDGVGAKTVAKQLVKREEEEKEVVSDMDAQAAEALAQEAPVLVAQAATGAAPTSSDSAAAVSVQAATSAPAAAAAVNPLWLGVGAIGLVAAAGGGGGDNPAPNKPLGPTQDVDLAPNSVSEAALTGVLVGVTAKAVDENASDVVEYAFAAGGNPGGLFGIDAKTGVITLAGELDYEKATSHEVKVVAKSSDGSFTESVFTIQVTDVNEFKVSAVTDGNPAANTVAESAAVGAVVGVTALASDADRGATVSYSLVDREGKAYEGPFAIDATTGVVTVADALDHEAAQSHELIVKATSSDGSSSTEAFVVNVTNVNDNVISPITDADPADNAVSELAQVGSVVGLIASATDGDRGALVTYELVDNAEGRFAIDASTGVITVAGVLDYETSTSHTVVVRASSSDGSAAVEKAFAIDVIDDGVFDFYLTTAIEPTNGTEFDDQIIGGVSDNFLVSGNASTYQSGDVIDGHSGSDTLKLSVTAGAVVDRATVRNVENLELSITADATGGTTAVFMTDWDASLQQMNIRSNKSDLVVHEQKTVANISITDQSTENQATSYDFRYAAGVLDGSADRLNLSVDNVNHQDGADVKIDAGMESIAINVADRAGPQYASNIDLTAAGVADIDVTGGRSGQTFKLNADVASGAAFNSSTFAGDMDLVSSDIKTATFGAGDDVANISGQADLSDSSYDLGEGDNTIDINGVNLGGAITAGDGVNIVNVNANSPGGSVLGTGSITLGDGGNRVNVEADIRGQITVGSGDDHVAVGNEVTGDATIDMGDGFNRVEVADDLRGNATVTFGNGNSELWVGNDFRDSASVSFVNGDNAVYVYDDVRENASLNFGAGDDLLSVGGEVGESSNTDSSTVSIDFAEGDNDLRVAGGIADSNQTASVDITFGNGDNTAWIQGNAGIQQGSSGTTAVTFGDGNNELLVGFRRDQDGNVVETGENASINGATVTFGNGSNFVQVADDLTNAKVTFGNGDNNTLNIGGDLTAGAPGTITFGDGNNNVLNIGGNLLGDAVIFGDGSGNSFTIGNDVSNGASITLGDGGNSGTVMGDVRSGAQITFGAGADHLTVAADMAGTSEISGVDVATRIDMGAGQDQATLLAAGEDGFDVSIIQSGGFVLGGEGADTLTLRAENSVDLIERIQQQVVTLDLSAETFALGDVITVTFTRGEETITVAHEVTEIVQGPENLSSTVAQALATKLAAVIGFDASALSGLITITSDEPHEDYAINSTRGEVEIVQISDARISSFETVELVALDMGGEDYTDIGADFDLIDGTDTIKLDSQVGLINVGESAQYETSARGGVTTFELSNLQGGEAIHVAGHEASATGNRQVERITVGNADGDHQVGDKLTLSINGVALDPYVVTAGNLVADTAQLDAASIATSLANHIADQLGADSAWEVKLDGNKIYLIGDAGEDVLVELSHTREQTQEVYSDFPASTNVAEWIDGLAVGDVIQVVVGEEEYSYTVLAEDLDPACTRTHAEIISEKLAALMPDATAQWGLLTLPTDFAVEVSRVVDQPQSATSVALQQPASEKDDSSTDVTINATLAEGATDTTMDLTVDGYGDFDIAITGGEDSGYTALDLKLGDSHDHTIDTGGIGFGTVPAFFKIMSTSDEEIGFEVAAYDIQFTGGVIARVYMSSAEDEVFISEDGGLSFSAFQGDLYDWAQTSGGYVEYEDFLLAIQSATAYSGEPGADGVQSYIFESTSEAIGNFRDAITVTDAAGVDTAGSNIVLENVLAHTVDTSASAANFSIDQYSVRDSDWMFGEDLVNQIDETISVTTGAGDDHLTTLAQSAMAEGSSIDLGTGRNTLSLGWGAGATLDSGDLENVGGITYTGDLSQLDILNDVVLDQDSTTLTMPNGVGGVETVTFTDVESNGLNDLTVVGAANDFAVDSADSFDLGGVSDDEGSGTLTVTDAAGSQITGALSVQARDGDARFNVGNSALATLAVHADVDASVFLAGNGEGAQFHLDEVSLEAGDDANLFVADNQGTEVVIGSLSIQGDDGADLEVRRNVELDLTVGSVELTGSYADVFINDNSGSSLVLGQVTIVAQHSDETNELEVADNEEVTLTIAGVDIVSDYEAQVYIDQNSDSDIAVTGDVNLTAGVDTAYIEVQYNDRTNVSLAEEGALTLQSCAYDADIYIGDNDNDYDPFQGGPDQGSWNSKTYTIALGDVVLDAGRDAELDIDSNEDQTYFGDMMVRVGDVAMVAYDDATMDIDYNDAATVVVGDVEMLAQSDAEFEIHENDGRYYEPILQLGLNEYQEDLSDITVGNVVMEGERSDFRVYDNSLAEIVVGDVTMTSNGGNSSLWIGASDSDGGGFDAAGNSDVHITLGDVSLSALDGGEADLQIVYNYSGGNAELFGETTIELGKVSLYSESSDVTFDISDNDAYANSIGITDGDVGLDRSISIVVDDVTLTADAGDVDFAISDNDAWAGRSTDDASVDVTVGAVNISGDDVYILMDENSANASDGDAEVSVTVGHVTAEAGADLDFEISSNAARTDDFGSASVTVAVGNVDLSGTNYADFLIQDNDADASDDVYSYGGSAQVDISVGSVTIDAQDRVFVYVEGNDAYADSYNDDASVTITLGDVNLTSGSGSDVAFSISDNDADSWGYSDGSTVASVSITTGDVSVVSGSDAEIYVYDNDALGEDTEVSITMGDLNVSASGDVYLEVSDNDNASVTIGDLTVDAGDFAEVLIDGSYGITTTVGDVTITTGQYAYELTGEDSASSDVFLYMEEIEGTESVTIDAGWYSDGDSDVYANFDDLYDLQTVKVTAVNAEMYFFDDIGAEGETFTLDLSGMTGSFDGRARFYDPRGSYETGGSEVDNGTYVVTEDALFGGDVVVKIGSGDLIYNAQHSSFGPMGEDNGDWYYDGANDSDDWFGDEGWYSLGDGLDLTPVREVQTLSWLRTDDGGTSETGSFSLQYEGVTYQLSVTEGSATVGGDAAALLTALGEGSSLSASVPGNTGTTISVTITGSYDGADVAITNVTSISGYEMFGLYTGNSISTQGEKASDGLGNDASETFEFVGESIGEVVIGGFRPNGFFAQDEVDRLDFSAFADIRSASDLVIYVEEGGSVGDDEAYFDDVIIDFVNQDYGSVRLVGAGEYFTDANVNGISNSIIFA